MKDSVTKKKLGDFVNKKLKNLGYKTKKLRVGTLRRARRTFKQAQSAQLYPGPARKTAGPKLTRPRSGAEKKPSSTALRAFPFQKKATEQELEDLQKRREPENIQLFQYTKDVLMDLAKKANITGRSTMTKGQLITALSTLQNLTSAVVEESKVKVDEKKVMEEKKLEDAIFENVNDLLEPTLVPKNKKQSIQYIFQLYDAINEEFPQKKIQVLSKSKLNSLKADELKDYLDNLRDLHAEFIVEEVPEIKKVIESQKPKKQSEETQMKAGLRLLERQRNLNFDGVREQKDFFQIGRELSKMGEEYQKLTENFEPDVKKKLDTLAKELGKKTAAKMLETGNRLRVAKIATESKPAEIRPPDIQPRPQKPIVAPPKRTKEEESKRKADARRAIEEEIKNKLVQEAQRLEKIEREKKEADAKKKAELDEKRRKAREVGRQTREAERLEDIRLKEAKRLALLDIQRNADARRAIEDARRAIEEEKLEKAVNAFRATIPNMNYLEPDFDRNLEKIKKIYYASLKYLQLDPSLEGKASELTEEAFNDIAERRRKALEDDQRRTVLRKAKLDLVKELNDTQDKVRKGRIKNPNVDTDIDINDSLSLEKLQMIKKSWDQTVKPAGISASEQFDREEADRKRREQREKDEKAKRKEQDRLDEIARREDEQREIKRKAQEEADEEERKDIFADIRKTFPKVIIQNLQNLDLPRLRLKKEYYYFADKMMKETNLKKIENLLKQFPKGKAVLPQNSLEGKTAYQLQVIADYLGKIVDPKKVKDPFRVDQLGAPRGPQVIAGYQPPRPEKPPSEDDWLASRTSAPVASAPVPIPDSAPSPAPAPVAPVPVAPAPAPAPRARVSRFSPDYVTGQPNTRNIPREGDTPIIKQTGIPPSQSAPASTMDGPTVDQGGTGARASPGSNSEEGAVPAKFGIDNHTIDEFLSKYGNEYLGCIAHDEIPSKIYPKIRPRSRGFFVINTDPSWKSGEHWQCVFFDARPTGSGSIEFYDSFADPIDSKMQADIKGIAERLDAKTYLKLKENRVKQQHDDSDNCGYFCMNFITSRMRGKPFTEASGFDESVKGEADIHKFKKMNGFGFLPSFGQIASTIARPFTNGVSGLTRAVGNTVERVKEGATKFAQDIKERIFFPDKKLPSSIQPLFEKYKNYKIISAQIRREPILAFVDKFINLISFGKYDQAKKELGYDKMFHLSLILQLSNPSQPGDQPKLLIEKNERINMTTTWKDGPQVQYSPAQGVLTIPGNPTLGEFYEKTLKAIGEHRFFTYNAFDQNCQRFIADLLRSNGALTPEAETFVMQDAKTVAKQLPFFVSKVAQFATDTAGRVRQFFGFGSTGPRLGSNSKAKVDKRIQRRVKFEEFMNKIAFSQKMK